MWETTLCGVGIIFGAGIYALVGKAAGMAGNAVWVSFGISAVLAALTGLSYAELSSMFPKAGAEYVYSLKAFGKRLAFITGWMIFISGVFSATAVSLGFSGYFSALFGTPIILTAVVLVALLCLLLMYGVRQSAWVGILFTLVESAGLVLIVLIGIPYFGTIDYFQMNAGLGGILGAAALIFFAFIGFEDITRMSEETKDPKKSVPRALVIAIAVSTMVYVLVSISAVSILGADALGSSSAPMADVADRALGPGAHTLLSIIALFSTSNTVLLVMLATSRILYGMASAGTLPGALAWVHPRRRTPWTATILVSILAVVFLALKDISVVASITDFAVFMTFVIINLSMIRLRYVMPEGRGFRVPLSIGRLPVLPAGGAALSFVMMLSLGMDIIALGLLTALAGLVVYVVFEEKPPMAKELDAHHMMHHMEHAMRRAKKKYHKIGVALRYQKT